jgi:hypothetical protein
LLAGFAAANAEMTAKEMWALRLHFQFIGDPLAALS